VEVGEIAASTPGDKNFFAQPLGTFEYRYSPTPLACFDGTHQSSSAAAENQSVVFMDQESSRTCKQFGISRSERGTAPTRWIVTSSAVHSNKSFGRALTCGRVGLTRRSRSRLDVVQQRHKPEIHM
jgi:hypothetical protein